MRVTHLSLTDFRNYRTAEVPFAAGANLFVGRNRQGNTNLVESLGYGTPWGSRGVAPDAAMIRKDAESAVVRARIQHEGRELLVEVQLNRGSANRAQVNRAAIKPRELPRYFSSVLFAPEDLALVRGEPGIRRRFLDQLLIQRSPRFSAVIADYERVLKQRNTLLKSARATRVRPDQLGTLDIWDDRLIALGSELIDARLDLVARLSEPVVSAYRSVAGDDHHPRLLPQLTIRGAHVEDEDEDAGADVTASAGDTTETFRQALVAVRPKELERGLTLIGPHRDDVLFELNGLPAKGYASHGESWSFALALKLASAELLRRESSTGDPVLILDDVFAELDQARRRMLATAVAGYEQVLITAAVYDDVPDELTAHTVRIEAGTIVEPA
ncbi:MAG: DNA replication/repair protein RecF [Leifsonia sp.]|uniref:DNA replication/repair protein RecF n=1 Tax=Leifsonia sp. TaxID=1870902 RepID=UPI003F7EF093